MFDLEKIWTDMGPLSRGIALFLAAMLVAGVGVFVERLLAMWRARSESRRFARAAREALANLDLSALSDIARRHPAAPLGRLFAAIAERHQRSVELAELDASRGRFEAHGFAEHRGHAHEPAGRGLSPAQAARNEADRAREAIGADLRRGMSVLASVGSVAPFVGLLGTVVGIITTFNTLGAGGGAVMTSIMSGIGEALAETALGLLVAIPAVLFFNYLTTRIAALELALARSAGELCDEMEERDGHRHERRERARKAA